MKTFSEIEKLPSGEIIPEFEATIIQVYQQRIEQGKWGPWHSQGLILQDQDGKQLHGNWGGTDPFTRQDVGRSAVFTSTSTQYGMKGLAWNVRQSKGKEYREIKITDSAKIKFGGNGAPPSDALPVNPAVSMEEIQKHLNQSCALYALAIETVDTIIKPRLPQGHQTHEIWDAIVGRIFTNASYAGLVPKMPPLSPNVEQGRHFHDELPHRDDDQEIPF